MNKQEWMNDLMNLQSQKKNIEGAIQYIINKIQELDRLEKIEDIKESKECSEEQDV